MRAAAVRNNLGARANEPVVQDQVIALTAGRACPVTLREIDLRLAFGNRCKQRARGFDRMQRKCQPLDKHPNWL